MKTLGLLSMTDVDNFFATKESVLSFKKYNGNDIIIVNTQHTQQIDDIGRDLNIPVYNGKNKFNYPMFSINELDLLCDWIINGILHPASNLSSDYFVMGEPDCLFFKKTELDSEDDAVDIFPPSSVENDKSLFWAFVSYYRSYGTTDDERSSRIKILFDELEAICKKYGLDFHAAAKADLRFSFTAGSILKTSRVRDLYLNHKHNVAGLITDICHAIYKNKPNPEINRAITSLFPVDAILSIVLGLYMFKWSIKKNYFNHSSHNFADWNSVDDFIKNYKDTECIHGVKLNYINRGKSYGFEHQFTQKLKNLNMNNNQKTSNAVILNEDPKKLVDYCVNSELMYKCIFMQVYEEFLTFSYWVKGFAPNNILEIGTTGSTFWIMSKLSTGKKISADIEPREATIRHAMYGEDWEFILGDTHTSEVYNKISSHGKFDLIFIDGDHTYDGVKKDFDMYKNLLSDRGYIAFHDIDPNHIFADSYAGQVYKFWKELNEGTKINLICTKSSGKVKLNSIYSEGFGGIGLWRPN